MWFLWLLGSSFFETEESGLASKTGILLPRLPMLGFQACMTLLGLPIYLFEYSILSNSTFHWSYTLLCTVRSPCSRLSHTYLCGEEGVVRLCRSNAMSL